MKNNASGVLELFSWYNIEALLRIFTASFNILYIDISCLLTRDRTLTSLYRNCVKYLSLVDKTRNREITKTTVRYKYKQ